MNTTQTIDTSFYDMPFEGDTSLQDFTFYSRTKDAWEAMYQDCSNATQSIIYEQYILLDDEAGRPFLELFTSKAKQGIKIKLLLDNIGSSGLESSQSFKAMCQAGVDVKFYNHMGITNIFLPSTWCPRNHVKTLLIDDKIGYVGSACVAEEMREWYDFHCRFTGEMADILSVDLKKSDKDLYRRSLSARHDNIYYYSLSYPHVGRNPFYRDLVKAIHQAKKSVRMVTPYFLPPWLLRRAMYRAVRRGVKVQVMISEKTDVRIADFVTRSYFKPLLRHGVQPFLFQEGMLHSKYVVIDDNWTTIGSHNLDYLSLLRNREANIVVRDKEVAVTAIERFEQDLKVCQAVDFAYCRAIPRHEKMLGMAGRLIKRVL